MSVNLFFAKLRTSLALHFAGVHIFNNASMTGLPRYYVLTNKLLVHKTILMLAFERFQAPGHSA